jgi:hypothetical protein
MKQPIDEDEAVLGIRVSGAAETREIKSYLRGLLWSSIG